MLGYALTAALALAGMGGTGLAGEELPYQAAFYIGDCDFRPWGVNAYFMPLIPNYGLYLAGEDEEEGEYVEVLITVEWQTRMVAGVRCAVVQEKEWIDEELVEISRNYFAICRNNKTVFYFGEDVDIYEDGEIVSHDGAWLAGEGENRPGVVMPGFPLEGSRYYQEWAPDVALDRAEHLSATETVTTPAGTFHWCLMVAETTPLEPDELSFKVYAPGTGLIRDDVIELIEAGYGIKRKYDR
jgi:hypothetical protein